jgi:hypothetical protein
MYTIVENRIPRIHAPGTWSVVWEVLNSDGNSVFQSIWLAGAAQAVYLRAIKRVSFRGREADALAFLEAFPIDERVNPTHG